MATTPMAVCVNGQYLNFSVAPQEENSQVLAPMRSGFEVLGTTVNWGRDTKKITATKGDPSIILYIGNPAANVNGESQILTVPAKLISGTTLGPLRFIGQVLG